METFDPNQQEMFPLNPSEESDVYRCAAEILRENLLAVLIKVLAEARKGNLQAAKFLYPFIPGLLEKDEQTDIWQNLREDDEGRQN